MNKRTFGLFFSIIYLLSLLPLTAAEDGKHLFILSGQSNMRKPLPETFRKCVSGVFGEDQVLVSTVARASQPIKRWYKEWTPPAGMEADPDEVYGDLYDKLIANVRKGGLKSADFAKLTDGKYGSSRHSDSEWLMIEASGEPVELILDLGKVQQVDLVGVHTLFSKKAGAEYPDSLQFLLSEDGENFQLSNSKHNNTKLNRNDRQLINDIAGGEECLLVLTEQSEHRNPEPGVSARFVKVLINSGTQNVLIDEIIVNPVGEQ